MTAIKRGDMEALLYEKKEDKNVRCCLCGHNCLIRPGKRGLCAVRENRGGELVSLVYGKVIARNIDPIEKKPLFHVYPGSLTYSIATVGCNLKCRFCQNADIAQLPSDQGGRIIGRETPPQDIVNHAAQSGCRTIAYTYTEPTVYFEYALDTAKLAHNKGIANVFVTNGSMSTDALGLIAPYLSAANVDLKAYSNTFYKEQCGYRLDLVKKTLVEMKKRNIFIEITTLLIPDLNDNKTELADMASFIANELGDETPWHISRFYPTYKLLDKPRTPVSSVQKARDIGFERGLKYVYTGNAPGDDGESTFCYGCREPLIERWGFSIRKNKVRNGACPKCGATIHGIGLGS